LVSIEIYTGFKLELQPDDTILCKTLDSSVILKISDSVQVIQCFDISEIFERYVAKGNCIPALVASIILTKFERDKVFI
jgi:hypothetical protein